MSDRAAIEHATQTYFDGLYEGDAEKLKSVFHATSSLTFEHDGKLVEWPLEKWLEGVRSRPSSKAQGLPREDAILHFDQSGPTTAFVKVKCQLPPRFFTDYLAFVKADGEWKVAQKIFATEIRK